MDKNAMAILPLDADGNCVGFCAAGDDRPTPLPTDKLKAAFEARGFQVDQDARWLRVTMPPGTNAYQESIRACETVWLDAPQTLD